MRYDCAVNRPSIVLPHHCRPGSGINPIRQTVQAVGYEGSEVYIGEWLEPIVQACTERGWRFHINPESLADMDIVIACRGIEYNGYVQRHWKSNVKLANAHGTGTPFIGPRECGYMETSSGFEQWADSPDELGERFDRLTGQSYRQAVQDSFLSCRYTVDDAAKDLKRFLSQWTD